MLLGPLKLAFSLGLGLVVLLLVGWSIDWVYVSRVWPDGADRLRSLLATDLGHGIALAARQGRGAGEITGPANLLYGLVFEVTGIHDMAMRFAEPSALSYRSRTRWSVAATWPIARPSRLQCSARSCLA